MSESEYLNSRSARIFDDVEKAWKGESGDKRNTKYVGAFEAGGAVGGALGYGAAALTKKPALISVGSWAGGGGGAYAYNRHRASAKGTAARKASIAAKKRAARSVNKAWKGEKDDKRNTKYAAAAAGGILAGGTANRAIPSSNAAIRRSSQTGFDNMAYRFTNQMSAGDALKNTMKTNLASNPGYKKMLLKGNALGLTGAAAATGGVALARKRKNERRAN